MTGSTAAQRRAAEEVVTGSTATCRRASAARWGLAATMALGLSAVACGPTQPRALREAKILEQEHSPDKLVLRGQAFARRGDHTRAEQYYAAALREGAPEDQVLPMLLQVCIEASRYQVALEYAEPWLTKHPRNYRLRLLVASLRSILGDVDAARREYERVVEEQPNQPLAHYALGTLLRDEYHDRLAADGHFREYLRLAPNGPHAEEVRDALLRTVPHDTP